jgi:hypothetical protein
MTNINETKCPKCDRKNNNYKKLEKNCGYEDDEELDLDSDESETEEEPVSPSHPKNLYGSATAMTTNWDW